MSDDRYRQIFESFGRDLFAVAKKYGKRALREAVRDAANGNLLQEEDEDDIPPDELKYPDEDVWTLPAPEDEDEETGEDESDDDELSEAAERVASELAEKLERRSRK
jgi:hypothetical protein